MSTTQQISALDHTIVVIPALEPDTSLPKYAAALLSQGAVQVLVVNDGSPPTSDPIFAELEEMDRCTVLHHECNLGKGQALKTAFTYILAHKEWNQAGIVTADADGQHSIKDVCAVAQALKQEKKRLVLGVRNLRLDNVPTRSKIGNRLTSWAFHMLYGIHLEDTQTGLRGIPWNLLEWCCTISGSRFEYEMNMLIRTAREHIELCEVPIQVIYYDNNAVTHLRTFRDSWRVFRILISGLEWYFIAAVLSAAADVFSFWLCSAVIFDSLPHSLGYWWSTLLARTFSSSLNYTLNRSYVFGSNHSWRTLAKYYFLWLCQLLSSYLLLLGMKVLFPGLNTVIAKILVDIPLAIGSYQVQMHWVFRKEKQNEAR